MNVRIWNRVFKYCYADELCHHKKGFGNSDNSVAQSMPWISMQMSIGFSIHGHWTSCVTRCLQWHAENRRKWWATEETLRRLLISLKIMNYEFFLLFQIEKTDFLLLRVKFNAHCCGINFLIPPHKNSWRLKLHQRFRHIIRTKMLCIKKTEETTSALRPIIKHSITLF